MRARLLVVPAVAAFATVLALAATALVAESVRPGQGPGTAQGQETQGAPRGQGRGAGAGGRGAGPPRDVAPAGTAAVTDLPIEVRSENVSGLNVIFTDKISSLAGSVRDSRGNPIADATVIAFPSDERLWAPQSRQIVTARTNASGAYRLAQFPPGDYFVVAVDEVEQGEWFDPAFLVLVKDRATKVSVAEGEQRTQDLKAPSM